MINFKKRLEEFRKKCREETYKINKEFEDKRINLFENAKKATARFNQKEKVMQKFEYKQGDRIKRKFSKNNWGKGEFICDYKPKHECKEDLVCIAIDGMPPSIVKRELILPAQLICDKKTTKAKVTFDTNKGTTAIKDEDKGKVWPSLDNQRVVNLSPQHFTFKDGRWVVYNESKAIENAYKQALLDKEEVERVLCNTQKLCEAHVEQIKEKDDEIKRLEEIILQRNLY